MTIVDCTSHVEAEISLIHTQSLAELSSLISDGTAQELTEARARAKSQQMGVGGITIFTGFVAKEKRFVQNLRKKHREVAEKKRALSTDVLYAGKAAQYESKPVSRPVVFACHAEGEKQRRLEEIKQRVKAAKGKKEQGRDAAARFYEEKKKGSPKEGKEGGSKFTFGSSKKDKESLSSEKSREKKRDKMKGALGSLGGRFSPKKKSPKGKGSDPQSPALSLDTDSNAIWALLKLDADVEGDMIPFSEAFFSAFEREFQIEKQGDAGDDNNREVLRDVLVSLLDIDQKGAVSLSGFEAFMGKWRKSGDDMAKYLEAMSVKAKKGVKAKVYTKSNSPEPIGSPVEMLSPEASPVPQTTEPAVEPKPESPAPESPKPESPAPESPAPESPAPESPAPESPAPESPAPESPPPVPVLDSAPVPKAAKKGVFGLMAKLSPVNKGTPSPDGTGERKRDKLLRLSAKVSPKNLAKPSKFFPTKLPSLGLKAGLKASLSKVGSNMGLTKKEEKTFSYKESAERARLLWNKDRDVAGELGRSFVKGCIVFAVINVLEKEKRAHIQTFEERKRWSSRKEGLVLKVEEDAGAADALEDEIFGHNGLDDVFNTSSMYRESTMSLDDMYNPAPPSPIHARLSALESPSMASIRSAEGQENFWAVVERVFYVKPSKQKVEVVVEIEEEVAVVRKVIVEPRVKYTWVERRTWLDEMIKISHDNYGGGDGGVGGEMPDLLAEGGGGGVKRVQVKDFKKRGEAWARKRIRIATGFGRLLADGDRTLDVVKIKLFKKHAATHTAT